jgi:hypothetical protein
MPKDVVRQNMETPFNPVHMLTTYLSVGAFQHYATLRCVCYFQFLNVGQTVYVEDVSEKEHDNWEQSCIYSEKNIC